MRMLHHINMALSVKVSDGIKNSKIIYRQQQRTTLFDSSDTPQTANHHDDGPYRDEQVGCRQGGKG